MLVTVHTFVTADGVMQGPGAPEEDPSDGFTQGGWLVPYADAGWGHVVDGWFARADALLLGRRSFEAMRGYWSAITDPGDAVAAAYNTLPKYVASTTLTDPGWDGTTVLADDVVAQVRRLKDRAGGELQVHGSWQLVQALHRAQLVDGYRTLTFPVVLGEGKRLFAHPCAAASLTVTESLALPGGVVAAAADVVRFGPTEVGAYPVREDGRVVST